ncbi:MAG TPA: histidine kinase [Actinocrinis sp.]|nr:histidine kinase [Actinocrinis sp.]
MRDPIDFLVRRTPPVVLDTLIMLTAIYTQIWNARSAAQDLNTSWAWWVYLFPVAAGIPLFWRRRFPFTVFVAVGLISLTYTFAAHTAATHSPFSGAPIGLLVAIATVAYLGKRWQMRIAAVTTIAGTFLAVHSSESALLNGITYSFALAVGRLAHQQRMYAQLFAEQMRTEQESAAARVAEASAEERARIARDMHDVLAHSVSVMVVQAEAGPVVVRSAPEKAEQAFEAIADAGRDALVQLRRMLGVLREDDTLALSPQPTIDALPKLLESVRATGLDVHLVTEGEQRPLPADVEMAVYRTVQESLTNTVKHARACRSEVRLSWGAERLTVRVEDDGLGLSPGLAASASVGTSPVSGLPGAGRGLIGIRERISACGGEVTSGPGRDGGGYAVTALIPFAGR